MIAIVVAVVLGVTLVVTQLRERRQHRETMETMRVAGEEIQRLRDIASAAARETGLLLDMTVERDNQKRRADRFFELMEGIVAERDQWESIYKQQSRAAGGAQAMLLLALHNAVEQSNRLVKALRERGVETRDLSIDPALETTVKEFAARHPSGAQIARAPGLEAASRIQAEYLTETAKTA